jgi:putative endonuclease
MKAMVSAVEDSKNKRGIGTRGEKLAAQYLTDNKYSIIATNYRIGRIGEIDIIAKDGEYICFIEVKARNTSIYGLPREAVTLHKQKKIRQIASIYLANTGNSNKSVRFDVVEIIWDVNKTTIDLIKNAF